MSSLFDESGFEDISGDRGILKKILVPGDEACGCPQTGFEVVAHYVGTLDNGEIFDSSRQRNQPFKFVIGKGQVIKGWDQGFAGMKKGEKAILRCKPDYAYGSSSQGKIPANSTLNFEVELLSFGPKKKEPWEYDDEERQVEALKSKDQGTELFKEKRFSEAIAAYEEACELIEPIASAKSIWVTCKTNAAQCAANNGDHAASIRYSTEALGKDPDNIKALYRRGSARIHMGLAEEALIDLQHGLKLDPENKALKTEILKANKIIADAKKKEKSIFGNMFSKVSMYDDKSALVVPGSDRSCPKVTKNII